MRTRPALLVVAVFGAAAFLAVSAVTARVRGAAIGLPNRGAATVAHSVETSAPVVAGESGAGGALRSAA
jgi:hypothetical protein